MQPVPEEVLPRQLAKYSSSSWVHCTILKLSKVQHVCILLSICGYITVQASSRTLCILSGCHLTDSEQWIYNPVCNCVLSHLSELFLHCGGSVATEITCLLMGSNKAVMKFLQILKHLLVETSNAAKDLQILSWLCMVHWMTAYHWTWRTSQLEISPDKTASTSSP